MWREESERRQYRVKGGEKVWRRRIGEIWGYQEKGGGRRRENIELWVGKSEGRELTALRISMRFVWLSPIGTSILTLLPAHLLAHLPKAIALLLSLLLEST